MSKFELANIVFKFATAIAYLGLAVALFWGRKQLEARVLASLGALYFGLCVCEGVLAQQQYLTAIQTVSSSEQDTREKRPLEN
jgi:hypothetical protein